MIPRHTPVSDSDYFALLPVHGLQLAEEHLRQDLSTLRDNDFSTKDTVSGLLTIQSLQQTEQVTS
jgi:hypothetical protein